MIHLRILTAVDSPENAAMREAKVRWEAAKEALNTATLDLIRAERALAIIKKETP